MKVVEVTVQLEIDSNSEDEVRNVIQEMDYTFSKVTMEEGVGKQLFEKEQIINTQILDYQIL